MRIDVDKITDKPLSVIDDIPVSKWDLDTEDLKFVDDIHIECSFLRISMEILVRAQVIVSQLVKCSRCLNEVKRKVTQKINLDYNVAELGESLEIDEDIREQIVLSYPMKFLCQDDCKGLCPGCGVNLNLNDCKCH